VVVVPKDLQREFGKNRNAKTFFDKLSYTHQREYVMWIEEAKRDETRANRVTKAIEMLKKGKRAR
jgi:uncharacterized protein YdeI (YjbR/CyaY-like superfamily)